MQQLQLAPEGMSMAAIEGIEQPWSRPFQTINVEVCCGVTKS